MGDKTRVLNAYAGVGGNRKLWGDEVRVTAVEYNPQIADAYASLYPDDTVIVGDAHAYIEQHYNEFDIVWSSPPCQTHSGMRQHLQVGCRGLTAVYPDMKLWQEIIFLQANMKGLYIVENVRPYYDALVKPTAIIQRHYFWTNFSVPQKSFDSDKLRSAQIPDLQLHTGIDLSDYKMSNKRQVLRNCVYPPLGDYIMRVALDKMGAARDKEAERYHMQGILV